MPWYAIRVRSKHEKKISWVLRLRDFDSFSPLYSARHRWTDRLKVVQLPLFPCYVFCQFGASQEALVLQTPGVIDVVRFGCTPAPIDDNEIKALQRLIGSGCKAEPWASVVIGQPAIIIGGPLAGLSGVVMERKRKPSLVLSVTLLGRSVLVEIDRACIAQYDTSCGCAYRSSDISEISALQQWRKQ
jgi:transcription antitermination factor NusG